MKRKRLVVVAILAFLVGWFAMAIGVSQTQFLWAAYHHGGL